MKSIHTYTHVYLHTCTHLHAEKQNFPPLCFIHFRYAAGVVVVVAVVFIVNNNNSIHIQYALPVFGTFVWFDFFFPSYHILYIFVFVIRCLCFVFYIYIFIYSFIYFRFFSHSHTVFVIAMCQ